MFKINKYTKCYYQIVDRAKHRILDTKGEYHHIIPKCLGGSNDSINLVHLTGHEHFICHLLLTKMVDGEKKFKLSKAALMMAYRIGPGQERVKVTGRIYQLLKTNCPPMPNEVKEKLSRKAKERFRNRPGTFTGKKHTAQAILKMQKRKQTEEQKEHHSKVMKGKNLGRIPHNKGKTNEELYGIEKTIQIRKKQSHPGPLNGSYGKKPSEEQIARKRNEKLHEVKKECPHCGKFIGPMNYGRWHGNNCKKKE